MKNPPAAAIRAATLLLGEYVMLGEAEWRGLNTPAQTARMVDLRNQIIHALAVEIGRQREENEE